MKVSLGIYQKWLSEWWILEFGTQDPGRNLPALARASKLVPTISLIFIVIDIQPPLAWGGEANK